MSPPTQVTSTGAPRGVSPSLPLSSSSSPLSSALSSSAVASSSSLAGWPSRRQLADMWGVGLFCRLRSPSPLPLTLLSPPHHPPRRARPPRPLAPWIFRACCESSGVWTLCGPPPGVRFMIRATMARACSSGVPLPPNGGGAPTSTPVSPRRLPPTPSPSLRLALGGGASQVLGLTPHLLYQAAHKGRAHLLRGWPPLSFGLESASPPSPPRPCMPCAGSARCSGRSLK